MINTSSKVSSGLYLLIDAPTIPEPVNGSVELSNNVDHITEPLELKLVAEAEEIPIPPVSHTTFHVGKELGLIILAFSDVNGRLTVLLNNSFPFSSNTISFV